MENSSFFLTKLRSSIAPPGERFPCYFPLLADGSLGHVLKLFAIITNDCLGGVTHLPGVTCPHRFPLAQWWSSGMIHEQCSGHCGHGRVLGQGGAQEPTTGAAVGEGLAMP